MLGFFNKRISIMFGLVGYGAGVASTYLVYNKGNKPKKSIEFFPAVIEKKDNYDYLAPDTSEIRLLLTENHASGGSMAHCTLPPGKTSTPVKHKNVEELWYFIKGSGEIWLKQDGIEIIQKVKSGHAVSIPPSVSFQFRNTDSKEPLEIVMTTMPPWPGAEEAIKITDKKWEPSETPGLTKKLGQ